MNTFSSDYISSNQTGITSNVVKGLPRSVAIPIKKPKFTLKNKKQLKELSDCIKRLGEAFLKIT